MCRWRKRPGGMNCSAKGMCSRAFAGFLTANCWLMDEESILESKESRWTLGRDGGVHGWRADWERCSDVRGVLGGLVKLLVRAVR